MEIDKIIETIYTNYEHPYSTSYKLLKHLINQEKEKLKPEHATCMEYINDDVMFHDVCNTLKAKEILLDNLMHKYNELVESTKGK